MVANPTFNSLQTVVQGVSGGIPVVTSDAPGPPKGSHAVTTSASANQASIIVPYDLTRGWLMITSRSAGNETIDLGSSNVQIGGGIPIVAGGGFLFTGAVAQGPIWAVTTVPSSPLSYVEA